MRELTDTIQSTAETHGTQQAQIDAIRSQCWSGPGLGARFDFDKFGRLVWEAAIASQAQPRGGAPMVSTEHGPWLPSLHHDGETYCQKCRMRSKYAHKPCDRRDPVGDALQTARCIAAEALENAMRAFAGRPNKCVAEQRALDEIDAGIAAHRDQAPAPAPAIQSGYTEADDKLLTGQAQHLIGALMNHGLLPSKTLPEDKYLKLWDVVKAQLRAVHREAVRAAPAVAQRDAGPRMEEGLRAIAQRLGHVYWGAGEADCPADIKAPNGELFKLRCKKCGEDNPGRKWCAVSDVPVQHQEQQS